ncbi:MAG: hypothetical protein IPK95_05200 [Cellvibrionales bacterium]|nr:hypothetical protein [Cellvibrionales bacterium]
MQLSDDDRITHRPQRRSSALAHSSTVVGDSRQRRHCLLLPQKPDSQPLTALKQAAGDKAKPAEIKKPALAMEPAPATAPDPVAASEPPLEPAAEAAPLPSLDASDAGIRQELSNLGGWKAQTIDLLVMISCCGAL